MNFSATKCPSTLAAPLGLTAAVSSARVTNKVPKASIPLRVARVATCSAKTNKASVELSRRESLAAALALSLTVATPAFAGGNVPSGYTGYKDAQDGYAFIYPFGWQEVSVDGVDVVLKDTIEPLENVSVTLLPTKTEQLQDLGGPDQVAKTLIEKVLTAGSSQNPTLINASSRVVEGKTYYTFEYTADLSRYKRHAITTVAISNGRFFTLTTGCNERRWNTMKDKLELMAKSFYNIY
eukprot:CAMPEP_0196584916 /NCGR_PEP_ID=MMETSP1081-20130531/48968_1 /TAXON_ID=36882 /ORGANISM="Pyramimonas amylifera, Strain CCMP720" /LENGTH=237 /DNA_ID=CAMNT_0041906303 /DNA_START=69 /DNA_END=782 /DNA_ORIENTATION=+